MAVAADPCYFPYNTHKLGTVFEVPSYDTFLQTLQTLLHAGFISKYVLKVRHDSEKAPRECTLYSIVNQVECTKAFLPYFQTMLMCGEEREYCREMQHRWINAYRFAMVNTPENHRLIKHQCVDWLCLVKEAESKCRHSLSTIKLKFLIPFLPFIQRSCVFAFLPHENMCKDPSVQQLDHVHPRYLNMLKNSTHIYMQEVAQGQSSFFKPQPIVMRTTSSKLITAHKIVAETKYRAAAACSIGASDRDQTNAYFNHLIDVLDEQGFVQAKIMHLRDMRECTLRLSAFEVLNADICCNVFRDYFSSDAQERALSTLLQNHFPWDSYMNRMYHFWHEEIGVMIYNAGAATRVEPGKHSGVDKGENQLEGGEPLINQKTMHERYYFDMVVQRPYHFIVPLLPLIQNGVIFLQVPSDRTGVSIQDLSLSRSNVQEASKMAFIENVLQKRLYQFHPVAQAAKRTSLMQQPLETVATSAQSRRDAALQATTYAGNFALPSSTSPVCHVAANKRRKKYSG